MEKAMTRGTYEWRQWAYCVVISALLGGAAACAGNEPEVPRAGPVLRADTNRIAGSEAFLAFADAAHLDQTQRIWVARTLALHAENAASLQMTALGPEQLSSMRQQLVQDTVAHLRNQLPVSSWDAFTRSGLLPEVAAMDTHLWGHQ
jgi:hypothetical protein